MTRKNVFVMVIILAVVCVAVYAGKNEKKMELPKAVKAAVKAMFADAEIKKAETEKKCVEVYEVELDVNGVKTDAEFDADGSLILVETKEKAENLPAAVEKAAAAKGKIVEAEKKVVHAKYKLVRLDAPVTKYIIKVEKKDKKLVLKIAEDGKIIDEMKIKNKKGKGKEKDGDKD